MASIEQEVANAWNDDVVQGNAPFQIFDHLLSSPGPHHGAAVVVAITDAVLGQAAAADRKTRRVAFDVRLSHFTQLVKIKPIRCFPTVLHEQGLHEQELQ